MKAYIENIKREFHELLGLISVRELVSNKEIAKIAEQLQKKLVMASNAEQQEV